MFKMGVHVSRGVHCKCLSQFDAGIDSGLPYIYPIDQVVNPAGVHVLVKGVWIVPHYKRA
jgi:hypothetical protein